MKTKPFRSLCRQIRNRSFQRFFRCAALILTAMLLAVSFFYLHQKKADLSKAAQARANQAFINLQATLNAVQSNVVFLGSLNSVEGVVHNPNASLSDLKAVMEDICSFTGYSDYSSIEVFFSSIQKIYVSEMGFYSYQDYFDPSLLEALSKEDMDERWLPGRSYSRHYGSQYPIQVLTYVRRLPLFHSSGRGFITANISMERLRELILKGVEEGGLSVRWQGETVLDLQYGEPLFSVTAENSLISCEAFVDRGQLWQAVRQTEFLLLAGYFILLALCFLLAIRYSILVEKPARELLHKLGIQELDESEANVYGELEEAVDALSARLSSMSRVMRQNHPLVQEQLLHQLVCREGSFGRQLEECTRCGITFPNPFYAVILLDSLDSGLQGGEREQLQLLCRENCLQVFSGLGRVYAIHGENGSQIFLLNAGGAFERLEPRIMQACQEVSKTLEGVFPFGLRFSVGLCDGHAPSLYRAYLGARRGLSYTSADSEGFVVFSQQEDETPYADSQLVDDLAQAIFQREPKRLGMLLARHRRWYLGEDIPIRQARRAADLCLCSVFSRLLEGDYRAEESGFSAAAKKLSQAETPAQCHEALSKYFHSLIQSHEKISERSYAYVEKAVAYIEAHYGRNFAIPEIAQELSINPTYLNRIFKLAKGKTVSEYLNFYRISLSIPMLQEDNRTVSEISGAVGYPDVRNYIRFFKKFYGATPSEYRRRMKAGLLPEEAGQGG